MHAAEQLVSGLKVIHGPFEGLQYPDARSSGSSLLPKLIGSYEHELHEIINDALGQSYTDLVDIGCAEGYYAWDSPLKRLS